MKYNPKLAEIVNKQNSETPKTQRAQTSQVEPDTKQEYFFLGGDFGRKIHERIITKYAGIKAITKVEYTDNLVKGSTPFYVVAVNDEIRSQGLATATQADLENILRTNALELKGVWEDTGLVLRNTKNQNAYLANHLAKQLNGIDYSPENPLVIWLKDLTLSKDANSPNKLAFNILPTAKPFNAPQLALTHYCKKFSIADANGMPIFDQQGNRIMYTIDSGLSRLFQDGGLNLSSVWNYLKTSNAYGRVVVVRSVSAIGTPSSG